MQKFYVKKIKGKANPPTQYTRARTRCVSYTEI